ncbi:hypothetical protein PBY51_014306 [Eleginops maclovinus]|uniref:Uncharacterized protein n=1 Tax=Eleginops maclovinus TaxID=56733 RepID=A0AAN7WWP1_ELEMC|nr:hypothetical protein PBY51_014306 [Eleginops maclovinus]
MRVVFSTATERKTPNTSVEGDALFQQPRHRKFVFHLRKQKKGKTKPTEVSQTLESHDERKYGALKLPSQRLVRVSSTSQESRWITNMTMD